MFTSFFSIFLIFSGFCLIDRIFVRNFKFEGVYYLLHAIHNIVIIGLTYSDVINTIIDFNKIEDYEKNLLALQFVFALHFYHIVIYWEKFRFDDWLHHILMIGIALPIGGYVDSKTLLGFSLFFTTGLPGGKDYIMLFLVRNGWMKKEREKELNSWINVWVRSPGCVAQATLTLVLVFGYMEVYSLEWWMGILVGFLNYWNGQYFMRQVVENNAITKYKSSLGLGNLK
jgi:hypothetical protein